MVRCARCDERMPADDVRHHRCWLEVVYAKT